MKKLLRVIILLCVCFNLVGCQKQKNATAEIHSEIDGSEGVSDSPSAILFYDSNRQFAYVLCGLDKGEYRNLNEYLYNEKDWSSFIVQGETDVETNVIKSSQEYNFYNLKGNNIPVKINKTSCYGRRIDDFTEVHSYFSPGVLSGRQIGLSRKLNPFPRTPSYEDKLIEVDMDGDGIRDKISWSFSDSSNEHYHGMQDYSILVTLNGRQYTFANPKELPLRSDDLAIFVMDLNNDGRFEIVVYEKLAAMFSSVTLYSTVNGDLEKLNDYIINPGP